MWKQALVHPQPAADASMTTVTKNSVAYVCTIFPAWTETFVVREVEELTKLGWSVTCFSLRWPSRTVASHEMLKWEERTVYSPFLFSARLLIANVCSLLSNPWRYVWCFMQLWANIRKPRLLLRSLAVFPKSVYFASIIRKQGQSRVHAHFAAVAATSAWLIAKFARIPFSFTAHAFDIFSEGYRDSLLPRKIKEAQFVACISNYNRNYLQEILEPAEEHKPRLVVVHCGVDIQGFSIVRCPPESSNAPTILSVGTLLEKKGHCYLIEAMALLRDRGKDFRCIIVGSGPLESELRMQVARHHLQGRVVLTGGLAQDKVQELMSRADMFCLACIIGKDGDRDGIPVALMEAMAKGIPVISTWVSGIPELITSDTGILVPERDEVALANAVELLIEHPVLRSQFGEKGRERVLSHFRADESAKVLASAFSSCEI